MLSRLRQAQVSRTAESQLMRNSIRSFGNASRHHYPVWDTGSALAPTRFSAHNTFPMFDSDWFPPSSSVTLYRNEFHHLKDNRNVGELDAFTAEKRPIVDNMLDLDWSFAGDPHNKIGFHGYDCNHYSWLREPTFPKTPDLSKGELAVGAMSTRTEVWKTQDEPAIVSVARFTPDHFRAYDYHDNAPVPATTCPDTSLDFRKNRLPLGHADRRPFIYFASAVSLGVLLSMTRSICVKAIWLIWPSKEAFAMGQVEVDLKQIRVGQNMMVKWRGKPIFCKRRSTEEIEQARSDDALIGSMRDPELDSERAIKAEYLITIGVCTHLGCIPFADQGDFNGYFCPCHGSHYDTSGRIRKGPAPKNLEIPQHAYIDDFTVRVG